MDKKGYELTLVELLKLALAFIIIVGVFIPLGAGIYDFFVKKADKQTLDNLATLASEVKTLEKGKSISVPLYFKDGFIIVTFNKDFENLPRKCRAESCLCLYRVEEGAAKETPEQCELMKDIKFALSGEKVAEGSSKVETFLISDEEGTVVILPSPKTI